MVLARLSVAFVAGVVLGAWLHLSTPVALISICLILAAAWMCRGQRWSPVVLPCAFLLLGLLRSPQLGGHPTPHDLAFYNGRSVEFHGIVSAEPDIRDTGANYVVTADHLIVANVPQPVSGRVQLHTSRSVQFDYGDGVTLTGYLQTPQNSNALPYRDILAHQGILSQMRYPRAIDDGPTATGFMGWIMGLRRHIEDGINAWLPEPEAALLIAITLGAKSASLGDLAQPLVATGLIHIIAISGIKVALVAGTVYVVAKRSGTRLAALVLSLSGLVAYVLLTGATASGERSAAMWAMIFVADYLGRGTVSILSLSVVAAAMVALNPQLVLDAGFQLTVFGTFAIVAFTGPLMRPIRFVPVLVQAAFAVTTTAQIGTIPVVALNFHLVSLWGPIANTLVLPLLPALIVLGFLLGVVGTFPAVAAPVSGLTYALLHAVIETVDFMSHLPLYIPGSIFSVRKAILYYAALAGASLIRLPRVHWAPKGRESSLAAEFGLALCVGASLLSVSMVDASGTSSARLTWLGTGGAILLRSHGMTALIDGSPRPFVLLERLGQELPPNTRSIDLVIVTDPRASNISGLEEVLRHYNVQEVLDVGAEYPSTTYARWRADLRARDIPVYALRTRATAQVGAARVTALGPDNLYPNPLDSVGLLRITLGGRTCLLAGLASKREQLEALFRPIHLRSDVLVMDGKKGYEPRFVGAVAPRRTFATFRVYGVPSAKLRNVEETIFK